MSHASPFALPLLLDLSDPATESLLADVIADGARNVAVDCAHPPTIRELVTRGVGATIAPRESVAEQIPDATTYSLGPPLRRDFGLIMRSGQPSPAAAAFVAVARQTCGAPAQVDDPVFE